MHKRFIQTCSAFVLYLLFTTSVAMAQTAPTVASLSASSGLPESIVTITGTSFTSTRSVLFGGQTARFTIQSDTKLSVIVPATANTGPIRITNPNGTVLTSPFTVKRTTSSTTFTASNTRFNYNPQTYNGGKTAGNTVPVFTDLDADGLLDLLVGTYDGNIEHYEQSGSKLLSFSRVSANVLPTIPDKYASPAITDLDGNGLLDLLLGTYTGTVMRYEQGSAKSSGFVLRSSDLVGDMGTYAAPAVTDLDGDGLLDLLIGIQNGTFQHFEQAAANSISFTRRTTSTTSFSNISLGSNQSYAQPEIIDLNGDGLLDLVIGAYNGNFYHYKQSAPNSLTFTESTFLVADIGDHSSPAFADLNGDGLLEMVTGEWKAPLTLYSQEQSPGFGSDVTLPVVWATFTAVEEARGVLLHWATSVEGNNEYFVIERSTNGKDYFEIGKTKAAGNSSTLISYHFLDEHAPSGTIFYRLIQVDFDGNSAFSKVVAIKKESTNHTSLPNLYPNPTSGFVHLDLTGLPRQEVSINIYGINGGLLETFNTWSGAFRHINLKNYSPGQYYIQVKGRLHCQVLPVLKN